MALQDSNPERRNLTVVSICIILFYLAEGEFIDSAVRLQVVNITFMKPEVLAYFTWCLLLWFCFRYWVVHQGSWRQAFTNEITCMEDINFIYYKYLKKRFELSDDYSHSYFEDRHWVKMSNQGVTKLVFQHIYKKEGTEGQLSEVLEATTFMDKLVVFICGVVTFFRRPSLSGYFIPYLLFAWAVFLGVYNAL